MDGSTGVLVDAGGSASGGTGADDLNAVSGVGKQ